jgi:chromosome partitioning protein
MPIVVTFVSQKGGVGKSTLARSVAVVLARAKVNVLVADCDDQQSTAVKWNRVRAENQRAPAIDVVSARSVAEAIARAETFDVAVLDMPCRVNHATLDAARQSHVIVQPTGPTLDDLYPSELLFLGLVAAGIPKERLLFVLCRTLAKGEEEAAREYLHHAEFDVLPQALPEKLGYREALNRGGSAIETNDDLLNCEADAVMHGILRKVNDVVARLPAPSKNMKKKAQ